MRFVLTMTAQLGRNHLAYLRKNLRAARAKVKSPLGELSVALVNDRTMSELHREFMKQRGPTDVLTFPLELDARGMAVAGEIVICVPQARRRAKIEGISTRHELLLYAIHGLLHLAGYDDRTKPDFHAMHQKEDMILTELGVGPVFSSSFDVGRSMLNVRCSIQQKRRTSNIEHRTSNRRNRRRS